MQHRSDYLCVFDTESDGVDIETAHIVTAFIGVMNAQTGELVEEYEWLINTGHEIPQGAIDVHGITNERMQAEGADPKTALFEIAQRLNICDRKAMTTVVMNMPYDISLLDRELQRYYPGIHYTPPSLPFDPMVIDKVLDQFRKGGRTLTDMAPVYGVEVLANAHDARADCIMAGQVALKMLADQRRPPYKPLATMPIEEIVARQPASKRKQAAGLAEFWMKKGTYNVKTGKYGFDKKLNRHLTAEEALELRERASTVRGDWPMIPRPTTETEK